MSFEYEDTWPGAAPGEPVRPPVRILLVDDNDDFLRQAARFLAGAPGCRVEAFAASGEEAVEIEKRIAPDLVLMDLMMPGIDGFEAARRIRARDGAARVVIMTLDASPLRKTVSENALADGLISKADFIREFGQALARLFPAPAGLRTQRR